MGRLRILLFAFVLGSFQQSAGQLVLTHAPVEGAFLAQNTTTQSANYLITGAVTNDSYSSFNIRVYQSNTIYSSHKVRLTFNGGKAPFKQMIFLPSGRHIYKIVYMLSGTSSFTQETDDIVVGDVYLIQGQSNAAAASYNKFDPSYYDKFCRSFGTMSTNSGAVLSDTNWYRTYADGAYTRGSVGQWGAVLAKVLVDSFHTPICILNGAVGGTRVTQHQPDLSNRTNLSTIYGRLLYRVQKAELQNHIRGILYFQGESDGSNAVLHDTLFQKLHSYWQSDFPGFEKLYVIQVRAGCGAPSIQLRDKQRLFEEVLENCQTVSANGLNNHDGCHYGFANGYQALGHQLAALVGRDYYKSKRKHINAPTIKSCHYTDSGQTEITLEFKYPEDSIYTDTLFQKLFRIEGDATVTITNGFIRDNQVVLQLNKSSCNITGITYDGLARTQPWVKGGTGMGLVSFYKIPIDLRRPLSEYQACKNSDVTIGVKPISGCKYLWKRQPVGTTFNTSQLKVTADTSYKYTFYTTYDKSACIVVDSLIVNVLPDSIIIPELGSNRTICTGEQITFSPDTVGIQSFTWSAGAKTINSITFTADTSQLIKLRTESRKGCIYEDSVQIFQRNPAVVLPSNIFICPGADTLITVADTFKSYRWNGQVGGITFKALKGKLELLVWDSFNCQAADSIFINTFETRTDRNLQINICSDDSIVHTKPKHTRRWWYKGTIAADNITLKPYTKAEFSLEDSNSCLSYDTIEVDGYELPLAPSFMDTSFCNGDTLELFYSHPYDSIFWNHKHLKTASILIADPGSYSLKIIDSNSCSWAGNINAVENPVPSLIEFHDTILCIDSVWRILLPIRTEVKINDTLVVNEWAIDHPNRYLVKATNEFGCTSSKTIDIEFVNCGLGVEMPVKHAKFEVYPNPFSGEIVVYISRNSTSAELYSIQGELIHKWPLPNVENHIETSHLINGTYLLRVDNTWLRLVKK